MTDEYYDRSEKRCPDAEQDYQDNKNGNQHARYKITEQQQQQHDAISNLEEQYKEKNDLNKKTKLITEEDEVEGNRGQKDSPRKEKGKKRFFAFFKELKKRSTWNRIVLHLRNLFKTKKQLQEEKIFIHIKNSKLNSLFGFRNKNKEKNIVTVRIAYLLKELTKLNNKVQNLVNLNSILAKIKLENIITRKQIQEHHIKSREAKTHSRIIANNNLSKDSGKIHLEQKSKNILNFELSILFILTSIHNRAIHFLNENIREGLTQATNKIGIQLKQQIINLTTNFVEFILHNVSNIAITQVYGVIKRKENDQKEKTGLKDETEKPITKLTIPENGIIALKETRDRNTDF